MTVQQQDVAAARAAAKELDKAVAELARRAGDSVDVRRLQVDAARVIVDLDLLAGPEPAQPERPELMVIPDGDYPASFWDDCEDEGVGRHR
ncbi:MAG: hypothetical protein M3Q27_18160 [Actinomycetota bacterium]|nr:hypothetical protein [Actinomycetota bacterium]